jgi:hypothetical protein
MMNDESLKSVLRNETNRMDEPKVWSDKEKKKRMRGGKKEESHVKSRVKCISKINFQGGLHSIFYILVHTPLPSF